MSEQYMLKTLNLVKLTHLDTHHFPADKQITPTISTHSIHHCLFKGESATINKNSMDIHCFEQVGKVANYFSSQHITVISEIRK